MHDFEKANPTSEFFVRTRDDLFMLVGPQAPSASAVEWLEREAAQFAVKRSGRAVYLHFVLDAPEFAMPDEEARAAMHRFVTRAGAKFAAAAVVIDQKGFLGSALRSVFSGVLLAVRTPTPTKICATAEEAHAFLEARVPLTIMPPPGQVREEIGKMQTAHA